MTETTDNENCVTCWQYDELCTYYSVINVTMKEHDVHIQAAVTEDTCQF
jgi:hypothetical protein